MTKGDPEMKTTTPDVLVAGKAVFAAPQAPGRKHRFQLPGFFTLSDGKLVYIEREFDLTNEMDSADAEFEENKEKYNNKDYSYPGAFYDMEYLAKRDAWNKWVEEERKINTEYEAERLKVAWNDHAKLLALSVNRVTMLKELEARSPQNMTGAYETPKSPVHRFENRIFRIDLDERIVEYRMANGVRGRMLITDLAPISQAGFVNIMNKNRVPMKSVLPSLACDVIARHLSLSLSSFCDAPAGRVDQNYGMDTPRKLLAWVAFHPSQRAELLAIFDRFVRVVPEAALVERLYTSAAKNSLQAGTVFQTGTGIPVWVQTWLNIGRWDEIKKDQALAILESARGFRERLWVSILAVDAKIPTSLVDGSALLANNKLFANQVNMNARYMSGASFENMSIPISILHTVPLMQEHAMEKKARAEEFFRGGPLHLSTRGKLHRALDEIMCAPGGTESDVVEREAEEEHGVATVTKEGASHILKHFALREGPSHEARSEVVRQAGEKFRTAKPDDMVGVPHLNKDIMLMPHQALAGAKLNGVERAVIDIDMGGGKTNIFYSDIMLAMQSGVCTRPCVAMPTGTVRQQVLEIKHKFGDNVNVIGITSYSFRKYGKGQEAYDNLARQIRGAPPNTIVFVGFEWLQGQPRKVLSGRINKKTGEPMKPLTDYWRSRFITDDCGCDMVTLDECHKIKNPDTARAKAAFGLGAAPVKRAGSGTLVPNTPDDIVGPMQFLDPTVFGDKKTFADHYGLSMTRGKIINFPTRVLKQVRQELVDYGMVSMRRTAWMHLMPKRTELFHPVRLSPFLQGLYNDLFKGIENQINRDPKLKEAWARFSEDTGADDVDIQSEAPMLLTMLGRLEQFITAPNSDIGGNLEDLLEDAQGEDPEEAAEAAEALNRLSTVLVKIRGAIANMPEDQVISPKCRKTVEIIDEHFSQPDPGKVIVFVSNVGSMKHFAKYIPMLSKMVTAENIAPYKADAAGRAFLEKFKKDPNIKVLVAVDQSLREGHNLQMASKLIRANLLWGPGDMEQTYGRVYRPGGIRDVSIDVLITEDTLEVAKMGRLLSKYDSMRRVNSEYNGEGDSATQSSGVDADTELEPIRMNKTSLEEVTHMMDLTDYITRYSRQAAHDMREAEKMASVLGTTMLARHGQPLPGAKIMIGSLPYYEEGDNYLPVNINIVRGPRGEKLIIDDPDSMESLTKSDANRLKLMYRDDGANGMFWRQVPSDLDAWVKRLESFGYTATVAYTNGVPRAITREQVETINREPQALQDVVVPAPAPMPVLVPVSDWEVVATNQSYAVYRRPDIKEDGSSTFRHVVVHHEDSAVGIPENGQTLATFLLSKDGPGPGGLTDKAWGLIRSKVGAHSQGAEQVWIPTFVPTVVAPVEEEAAPAQASNVVNTLRMLNYDGVWYITVDSDDDNAPLLRQFGLVWFNAFYQRRFENTAEVRRVVQALESKDLAVDGQEEFMDHARDAIWARKVPQRKLLREQLQTMKARRRTLSKGSVSIHYVQHGGQHHVAVSALENQSDLAKVRAISGFSQVNAAYWKPCPDREVLKNFVADLQASGLRVARWDEFLADAEANFHLRPAADLSAPKAKPAASAPSAPNGKSATLSPGKLAVLQAVHAQNAQQTGAVLPYGGTGGFNIASVQALIDKGFIEAVRNADAKQYEAAWLTAKGAEAIGVGTVVAPPEALDPVPAPEEMVKEVPGRVVDVAGLLDVPAAEIRRMVELGLVQSHKVPGIKVQWTTGVLPSEVSKVLQQEAAEVITSGSISGPSWTLSLDNMEDEFAPEARWVKNDRSQQIRVFREEDETWKVKVMTKGPEGVRGTTTDANTARDALKAARALMVG